MQRSYGWTKLTLPWPSSVHCQKRQATVATGDRRALASNQEPQHSVLSGQLIWGIRSCSEFRDAESRGVAVQVQNFFSVEGWTGRENCANVQRVLLLPDETRLPPCVTSAAHGCRLYQSSWSRPCRVRPYRASWLLPLALPQSQGRVLTSATAYHEMTPLASRVPRMNSDCLDARLAHGGLTDLVASSRAHVCDWRSCVAADCRLLTAIQYCPTAMRAHPHWRAVTRRHGFSFRFQVPRGSGPGSILAPSPLAPLGAVSSSPNLPVRGSLPAFLPS